MAADEATRAFQVVLELAWAEELSNEELEQHADSAVCALAERGRGVAQGPVVTAVYPTSTVELEFTTAAKAGPQLMTKLKQVLAVLAEDGFEFVGSTTSLVAPEDAPDATRELQPA